MEDGVEPLLGVAVHGAPDDADLFLAGTLEVGRVFDVAFDDLRGIPAPHDAVARRNHLDAESGELFNSAQHEGPEARDDIGIISEALGFEALVLLRREFVVEDAVAEHAEAPESVAGEEGTGGWLEGHHGLGPVHVRGLEELEDEPGAEVKLVPVLDRLASLRDLVEGLHELDALGCREDLDPGVAPPVLGEPARVVGLEVVEHEVVHVGELHASLRETGLKGRGCPAPIADEVDEGDLVALDEIRVERHTVRYGPDALEEVLGPYVRVQGVDPVAYPMRLHVRPPLLSRSSR